MKYLVGAEEPSLDAKISRRFGHAPYHLLVDAESGSLEVFEGRTGGDHGFKRFHQLEVRGIITGNIGPHAFEQASEAGWPVYVIRSASVRGAVHMVASGEVNPTAVPSLNHSVQDHAGDEDRNCKEKNGGRGCCGKNR